MVVEVTARLNSILETEFGEVLKYLWRYACVFVQEDSRRRVTRRSNDPIVESEQQAYSSICQILCAQNEIPYGVVVRAKPPGAFIGHFIALSVTTCLLDETRG